MRGCAALIHSLKWRPEIHGNVRHLEVGWPALSLLWFHEYVHHQQTCRRSTDVYAAYRSGRELLFQRTYGDDQHRRRFPRRYGGHVEEHAPMRWCTSREHGPALSCHLIHINIHWSVRTYLPPPLHSFKSMWQTGDSFFRPEERNTRRKHLIKDMHIKSFLV